MWLTMQLQMRNEVPHIESLQYKHYLYCGGNVTEYSRQTQSKNIINSLGSQGVQPQEFQ
jgi:hypothetical protein